jgi:ECF sigma factor
MNETPMDPRAADPEVRRRLDGIITAYLNRVIGLARKNLSAKLQQRLAPEDIAQSVFRTFFYRYTYRGQFRDLHGERGLWNLLAHLTVTRCHRAYQQHYQTAKRDVNRDVALEPAADGSVAPLQDAEPTPFEALVLRETLEQCFAEEQVDETSRCVIEAWLAGASHAEIAALDGVRMTQASIRKLCQQFYDSVLEKLRKEDPQAAP